MFANLLKRAGDSHEDRINFCRNIQSYTLSAWFFISIGLVIITGYVSYFSGRAGHYTDVNEDWKSCLFEPNYAVLPLDEIAETSPIAPVLDLLGASIDDKRVSFGSFVNALIYVSCNTLSFTLAGQLAIYRCWKHPDWILPAGFFGLWCSLLSLTYYTASPPLPIPTATTSTIILLSYWLKKSSFDNVNDGDNVCGTAYSLIVLVIVVNIFLVAMLAVANTMAFSVEIIRYQDKSRKIPRSLPGSTAVLVLTLCLMSCYVGEFIGRLVTSLNSLFCLDTYDTSLGDIAYDPTEDSHMDVYYPDLFYPFQPGYINLTSLCWAVVFVSATRAYFGGRLAAYKTAAAASLLYAMTNTSSMFYIMSLYYDLDLYKDTICFDYFRTSENAPLYLYPNQYQSKVYCQGTRVSTFLAVILYIGMTIMFLLTSYLYVNCSNELGDQKGTLQEELLGGTSKDVNAEYLGHDDGRIARHSNSRDRRHASSTTNVL